MKAVSSKHWTKPPSSKHKDTEKAHSDSPGTCRKRSKDPAVHYSLTLNASRRNIVSVLQTLAAR